MNIRFSHAVLAVVAVSASAAAAESWVNVDVLPGGFALQIDMASKVEEMDGVRLVERATFRKQLPTAMIETAVAIDCAGEMAKTRGVKMISDGKVLSDSTNNTAQYLPVHFGSAEAMYYQALCGKPVSDTGGSTPAAQ